MYFTNAIRIHTLSKTQKIYLATLLSALIFGGCFLIFFLNYDKYTVYPVDDLSVYEVGTYHEELDSNWSKASFDTINNRIQFTYKLSTAREEPFAAFYFRHADITKKLVDLEGFNSISLYLKSEHAQRIPVTLRFHNDLYLNLSKKYPEVSMSAVIDYQGEGTYTIPLSEFEIAAWWLRYHGIEKETIDLKNITELKYLAIGSCQALEPGLQDQITIGDVEFYNDYSTVYLVSSGFFLLVLIVIGLHWKLSNKEFETIVVKPTEIEKENKQLSSAQAIKVFIARNYNNPNLALYSIQKDLKLSANEVRKVFKEELNTSFKTYLKTVRLIEVKRLLKENTDLTISEIAYKCGFGDIPYFNRLFKSEFGITPKQFRLEHSNKS